MKKKTKKNPKISFVVNRKRWSCGLGYSGAGLDGTCKTMCCLGHLRTALKVKNVRNARTPMDCQSSKWPETLLKTYNKEDKAVNTDLCYRIMTTNDSTRITQEEREEKLTHLFKEAGIEVKFEG